MAQAKRTASRRPAERRKSRQPLPLSRWRWGWRLGSAVTIIALAVLDWRLGRLPIDIPLAYLALGMISFALYGWDKNRAEQKGWRVPEGTLHFIDLIGGIAGGLVAQILFRHKTSKLSFFMVSASFAVLHMLALLLILSPLGAVLLER